jgi:hypothetical protein
MVSSEQYTYSEVLEMLPYERDAFFGMIQDDAHKLSQRQSQPQM